MTTTGATSSTTAATGSTTTSTALQKSLGKDDFLKLLMAQLQHQDPMQPMDDTQFVSQMAQFSSLEQMTNVSDEIGQLAANDQVTQAVSMIGHDVTYTDANGSVAAGTVKSVELKDGQVVLTVNGASVDPKSLLSVA